MDSLSRLLALHPVHATLDKRCRFGTAWEIDHSPHAVGVAPYHIVLAGTTWLSVEGEAPMVLEAGDMLVLPRGQAHRIHGGEAGRALPAQVQTIDTAVPLVGNGESATDIDILCGEFALRGAARKLLAQALPDRMLVRTHGRADAARLLALVSLLREETGDARAGSAAVVTHMASALFALFLRAWMEQTTFAPGLLALLADRRLAPALEAMLAEPGGDCSIERLAERCHLSRASFLRGFRRIANATPGEVLAQIRMAQAATWLREGRLSSGEISERVGYRSEAAFRRAFKRLIGAAPGQYRREQTAPD
ncbi:AraC family transcriptional regulator [Niveibacterium sp. SC-1]|uniref:AraC family transcriptional regulator n=1 Tax=Niveibacterium sp. SC-1 TaxID=3135646 RepID=UPI00311FDB11